MNSFPFHAEKAVSEDYTAVCRLMAEEHAMHVTARPDIFQPCEALLTKEEFEAIQKMIHIFCIPQKPVVVKWLGSVLQSWQRRNLPCSVK